MPELTSRFQYILYLKRSVQLLLGLYTYGMLHQLLFTALSLWRAGPPREQRGPRESFHMCEAGKN